jgi:hypothetical protein
MVTIKGGGELLLLHTDFSESMRLVCVNAAFLHTPYNAIDQKL